MKRKVFIVLLAGVLLAACAPGNSLRDRRDDGELLLEVARQETATPSPSPTLTATTTRTPQPTWTATRTLIPSNTPTLTPQYSATPTPPATIAAQQGTAVPEGEAVLSVDNVGNVVEIARYGSGIVRQRILSADSQTLYVRTTFAVIAYDVASQTALWQFDSQSELTALALQEALNTMAVGDRRGKIHLLDVSDASVISEWWTDGRAIDELNLADRWGYLAVRQDDNVSVWRVPEGELKYHFVDQRRSGDEMFVGQGRLMTGRYLVDLYTGERLADFGNYELIGIFEEQGMFLVGSDIKLFLHSLDMGEEVLEFAPEAEWESSYAGAEISDDGSQLALAFFDSYPRDLRVIVWDLETGQELENVALVKGNGLAWTDYCRGDGGPGPYYITQVDYSADGSMLQMHSGFKEIVEWDISTGSVETSAATPDPNLDPPYSNNGTKVVFSSDGQWLVSGGNLWDLSDGEKQSVLEGDILAFSSNDRSVYAYSDKAILQFDVDSLELISRRFLGNKSRDHCSQQKVLAPDASLFFEGGYSGGDSYESFMWELSKSIGDWFELETEYEGRSVVFSSNGKQIVVVPSRFPPIKIKVYDLETGVEQRSIEVENAIPPMGIALSKDGSLLAAISYKEARVFRLDDPEKAPIFLEDFTNASYDYEAAGFSPDGTLLAVYARNGIGIWDANTGELLHMIKPSPGFLALYDLGFSPDGRYLAAALRDGTVRLWGIP